MPVKRKTKATTETADQRGAREEMERMIAEWQATRTPEQIARAERRSAKLDRKVDKRLKMHPEESRVDAMLAIFYKRLEKDNAKLQAEEDAEDEAEEAAEAARRSAQATERATAGVTDASRVKSPPVEPDELPSPGRRRTHVSITHVPFR